jgi:hypothetical protein
MYLYSMPLQPRPYVRYQTNYRQPKAQYQTCSFAICLVSDLNCDMFRI